MTNARFENKPALVVLILGLIIGIPIGLKSSLSIATHSPEGLIKGIPIALAYIAVVYLIVRISPAWPGRPLWWVFAAFLWGAGSASIFVTLAGKYLMQLMRQLQLPEFGASLAGALPEEVGKALGVFLILLVAKQMNRPWHGLIVGVMVGLGFAALENLGYGIAGGLIHPVSDMDGALETWIQRTKFGPALHCVYTGIAGWGIAKAMFTSGWSRGKRIGVALAWLLLSFLLHFAWNSAPENIYINLLKMVVTAIISYGLFIVLYVRGWKQAKRQRSASQPATPTEPSTQA
ncbi:PrsW family intramembrane metalloprotease [Corynebacterium pelargi]|uniref:Uncharacterized protein n=1 Tax=Corynebacterium pelargi TaxID=1471400 RepID=A0A410W788_9CORY|nr:PrsW family intramembrane metalloprotease [Corynebacterium pelargi]QAU51707.1 hypothetical protein CPELA_02045 [Corynebacterium pelargi]GGG80634.1 protease PrsW [Corynebacterium pelargi]